jgi:riboflavin kinase/FMN adenylyltransferase
VTVGVFDGVHRGHQEILKRTTEISVRDQLRSILLTFHPHPREIIAPDAAPLLLTTLEEKKELLQRYFPGAIFVLNFDRALMNLEPEQFVQEILIDHCGMRHLVIGHDHALGKNRSGDARKLQSLGKKLGFQVTVCEPVIENQQLVSSSRIRQLLKTGDVAGALCLLNHEYPISGTVERGIGLGKKLGYPTANVHVMQRKLLPLEGVYVCEAELNGEQFDGMLFVGRNHLNPEALVTVEAHLFHFDRDIYGRTIKVSPTHFLRENRPFSKPDALVAQIETDEKRTIAILQEEREHAAH